MQLTNRSKQVSNKEMTFSERMYLPAIVGGLRVTFSHMLKKGATVQYPEQVREHSDVFRGQHVLKRDAEGREHLLGGVLGERRRPGHGASPPRSAQRMTRAPRIE